MQGMYGAAKPSRPMGWIVAAVVSLALNLGIGALVWQQVRAEPAADTAEVDVELGESSPESPASASPDPSRNLDEVAWELDSCNEDLTRLETEVKGLRAELSVNEPPPIETVRPVDESRPDGIQIREVRRRGMAHPPKTDFDYAGGYAEVTGVVSNRGETAIRGTVIVDLHCGDEKEIETQDVYLEIASGSRETYELGLTLPFEVDSGCWTTARWEEER